MGRGNVNVYGEYEGLYYVDCDYLDYYTAKEADEDGEFEGKYLCEMTSEDFDNYEFDEDISLMLHEDFVSEFVRLMHEKFNSFIATGDDYGTIMENNLFEIQIEDNQWSYAVELIQKEDYYSNNSLEGLQKRHYQNYLDGMKNILLELFPTIGCYAGTWTHATITR